MTLATIYVAHVLLLPPLKSCLVVILICKLPQEDSTALFGEMHLSKHAWDIHFLDHNISMPTCMMNVWIILLHIYSPHTYINKDFLYG